MRGAPSCIVALTAASFERSRFIPTAAFHHTKVADAVIESCRYKRSEEFVVRVDYFGGADGISMFHFFANRSAPFRSVSRLYVRGKRPRVPEYLKSTVHETTYSSSRSRRILCRLLPLRT